MAGSGSDRGAARLSSSMAKERERVHDERVAEEVDELAAVADGVSPPKVNRVFEGPIDRLGVGALAEQLGEVGGLWARSASRSRFG